MKLKVALFIGSALVMISMFEQSCLPFKSYERNKQSNCMSFDPKNMEIEKTCNDGDYDSIVSLEIEVKYDTIKIINGKPVDSYTLYSINHSISFPHKLEPSVFQNRNKKLIISMKTNVRDREYALRINPGDWQNSKLAFTYYYNK
jgi:hypothetical protein